MGKNHSLLTN